MKYLLCFLFMGCTSNIVRTGIIHDYIFIAGQKTCSTHEGLHYVVQETSLNPNPDDKPCNEVTKFRCQDGSLHNFETGTKYCFISELQLNDTLGKVK